MWGKIKNNGDDWMYPKPMMDLRFVLSNVKSIPLIVCCLMVNFTLFFPSAFGCSGWNLRWMDSGSMHHFVGADSSCISWGHAQYGELGYGPNGQKYATP